MKNKTKNSHGYTLLELVAVCIILGIISTGVIIGYNKYLEKTKKNYYKKQQDLLIQAGKEFFNDNRGYLPITTEKNSCVLLETLVNNKYIDSIKNYDKKECSKTESKVCVKKLSLTRYEYKAVLNCD